MATKTSVVIFDSVARKHVQLAGGDKLDQSVLDLYTTSLAFNSATGVLTSTFPDGSVRTVNLAVASVDKFLASSSYNNATATLTLTMSDSSVINVPLGDLVAINSSNAGDVKFTGNGTAATPLAASVDLATATSAATVDTGNTPTIFFGSDASALGTPAGWATILVAGTAKRVPFYN